MFSQASNFTAGVDKTFAFILGVSVFFLVGITIVMIVFAIKYRRSKHPHATQVKENMVLEIIWILVPLVLVLVMFYFGYQSYMPMRTPPKDALTIKVYGKMWQWEYDYGSGKLTKDTLVLPLGKPVILELHAKDISHSFFIPAFRIKEDMVPKKTSFMWFIPQQEGSYEAFCTLFCGIQHSKMEGIVKVVPEKEYNTWLANLKVFDPNEVPEGLAILQNYGCVACHSLDGKKLVGPSFKGLYGSERIVVTQGNEHTVTADSLYIINSVVNPDADIVKDYPKGTMKSYNQVISNENISKIAGYIKSLNEQK